MKPESIFYAKSDFVIFNNFLWMLQYIPLDFVPIIFLKTQIETETETRIN